MDYIIYIATEFGEIKVCFETDGILKDSQEVLEIALEKLGESPIINVNELTKERIFYEVTEGDTVY